jgi:integrase
MAHVERRGAGRWRARYRDPVGRERSRTFKRKADADRFLTGVEADKLRGDWIDPRHGRVTFDEYARTWLEGRVHRETTAARIDVDLRRHILPAFEGRPLQAVRPSEVQAWVKCRAEVLAPSTVAVVYSTLSAIFRSAVADHYLARTPCVGVSLPKRERRRVEPLEVSQVHALAEAIGDRYRALIISAAGTGLRQGEALGLTIEHVDFLRRKLRVEQQLTYLGTREPFLTPPKTESSRRAIPLPQVVLDTLAQHVALFPPRADGFVFTDNRGRALKRGTFNSAVWRPAARASGLPPGIGFHALRHFYASALIRQGESVTVVQNRLGHATAKETLDCYAHLWPDSEDRTRSAIDAVLGAPADLPRPARGLEHP